MLRHPLKNRLRQTLVASLVEMSVTSPPSRYPIGVCPHQIVVQRDVPQIVLSTQTLQRSRDGGAITEVSRCVQHDQRAAGVRHLSAQLRNDPEVDVEQPRVGR